MEKISRCNYPWILFGLNGIPAGTGRSVEQGGGVSDVQIGNIVRQIKQMALVGYHVFSLHYLYLADKRKFEIWWNTSFQIIIGGHQVRGVIQARGFIKLIVR